FQGEGGIRCLIVTGVQTCALPICRQLAVAVRERLGGPGQSLFRPGGIAERPVRVDLNGLAFRVDLAGSFPVLEDGRVREPGVMRSEERRVGKECRVWWTGYGCKRG